MKNDATYFEKKAIVKFLENYGRPNTKDYEFAAALVICRLCEKRWGEKCWIGVRVKAEHSEALPAPDSKREITLEEISQLFRRGVDEDSPVDFVVAKMASMQKAQGMVFQVKRFGIGRTRKDTEELTTYLNSFSWKYSKTNANLLVCLDDWVNVDMQKLYANLNTTNFPFNRIIFNWFSDNRAYIKDVYPQGDIEWFPVSDLYLT